MVGGVKDLKISYMQNLLGFSTMEKPVKEPIKSCVWITSFDRQAICREGVRNILALKLE